MDGNFIESVVSKAKQVFVGVSSHDEDDMGQEMALKLWVERERVDSADDPEQLAFIVARNAAIDWLRKENLYHERMILDTELNGTVDGKSAAQKSEGGSAAAPLTDVEKVRLKLIEIV